MQDFIANFATADSALEQLEALRSLAQAKTLAQASKSPQFTEGLSRLAKAGESASQEQRLAALAALGRIWSSLKPLRPSVERLITVANISEPAQSSTLDDPDDRAYVAQAIRHIQAPWVARYAAIAAVAEEAAENARDEHVATLLVATKDLREAVKLLADRLKSLSFSTERPADSLSRRTRRLLLSVHGAMRLDLPVIAEGAGLELAAMVADAFRKVGPPTTDALKRDVVGAAAQVVHDIVRVRFAQASDPTTYDVLDVLRRWFRPHEWEEIATETAALRSVANDALEAITQLAKAGVTDDRLRTRLALAFGDDQRAGRMLVQLAESLSGVRPEIRHWLAGTEPPIELTAVNESAARNIDRVVADVLVRNEQIDNLANQATAPDVNAAFRLLTGSFRELARVRALELALTPGATVDYSPLDHEMVGGSQVGIRRVVVVEPQVRARQSDGSYRIVRKALVRPE